MNIKLFYEKNKQIINVILFAIIVLLVLNYMFPCEGLEDVIASDIPVVDAPVVDVPVVETKEVVMPIEEEELAPVPESQKNGGEIQPADLLPMSQEVVDFTKQFADGAVDLKDKNFLIAGYNIGINTVASSLKNANLQLRSDPYIPREDTGPWNQSTIMSSDLTNRKPLEIGTTI
jgi:hypothetical protein